jgi:Dullard-like phosphatase family protein
MDSSSSKIDETSSQLDVSHLSDSDNPPPRHIITWLLDICNCFKPKVHETYAVSRIEKSLLFPQSPKSVGKKTLVLDLDETLIHCSLHNFSEYDISLNIYADGGYTTVYIYKRPGVDLFLRRMMELYEIVIFTASLESVIYIQYANELLDQLNYTFIKKRLFRHHCEYQYGNFVKNLSRLSRDLKDVIIIDVISR